MPSQKPPTNEIGIALPGASNWNSFADDNEEIPALAWPTSVKTYGFMRRDSQIAALEEAVLLPILSRRWRLDPNGADQQIVDFFSKTFAIPVIGEDDEIERGRTRGRFRLGNHLREAMTFRTYGHMFFEQVYELNPEDKLYHLRKLAPRWQSSIQEIATDPDGGLAFIRQFNGRQTQRNGLTFGGTVAQPIPVNRLVGYVHRQEGNWYGTSILRPLYKHWISKDRLMRVDALKHERNGMGIPVVTAPEGAIKQQMIQAQAITTKIRAGEDAGATLPPGFKLELIGVTGTIPDTLASIRYHDEAMARVYLAMFMQLGTTETGSRALGESFTDFFSLSLDATCNDLVSVVNEHVIEDLVDANWGPDATSPLLTWDDTENKELEPQDLVDFVSAGVISLDDEFEDWVRSEWDLPERDETGTRTATKTDKEDENIPTDIPDDEESDTSKNLLKGGAINIAAADFTDATLVTNRIVERITNAERRALTPEEIASGVDFDAMESAITSSISFLVQQWSAQVRPAQIDALVVQIEAAGKDLVTMASIAAPVLGSDILNQELQRVVTQASAQAVAEAATQSVTIAALSPNDLADQLNQRSTALATVMAKSISEAAARHAINNDSDELTAAELAAVVKLHLQSLTDAYVTKTLGGAVHRTFNDSRFDTLDQAEVREWYASEILDKVTCGKKSPPSGCRGVDGKKYKTKSEMLKDYGSGRFKDCKGLDSCRGTSIAIYKKEQEATV